MENHRYSLPEAAEEAARIQEIAGSESDTVAHYDMAEDYIQREKLVEAARQKGMAESDSDLPTAIEYDGEVAMRKEGQRINEISKIVHTVPGTRLWSHFDESPREK
jgi:hypothetical protein